MTAMNLDDVGRHWDGLGRTDPYWAVLAYPERHGGGWAGDEDAFFATGRIAVDEVMATLTRLDAGPQRRERALDFGCGVGRLSQGLAAHFEQVEGIDIAGSMIERARSHNAFPDTVTYTLNERSDLTVIPSDSVDLVLSIIVLQHMNNDLKAAYLREFLRVLRPGGVLAVTIPSHGDLSVEGLVRRLPNSWQNIYRRRVYGYDHVMEFYPWKRPAVEECLRDAGGQLVAAEREYMAGPRFTSYLYVVRKPH